MIYKKETPKINNNDDDNNNIADVLRFRDGLLVL